MPHGQHNDMNPHRSVIEALENRTMFDASALAGHVTDAQAEVLARVVAYENFSVGSTPLAGSGYVVNHVFDNMHDGFQALGLVSPTEAPVLVLRGTDDSKDVTADSDRAGVGFNQFSDNWPGKKGVKAWLDSASLPSSGNIGGAPDIVGHSLGGALAQWFAAAYTHARHNVGRVVTFNSPGISASFARRFIASRAISVTDYITSDDIVSMAGQAYLSGQYDLVHYNSESELAPNLTAIFNWELTKHTTPVLTDAGGTVPADETIDAPAPTSQLSSKTFVYSDPEYSDMLQDLKTAISIFPAYRNLPAALTSRAKTEAIRPTLFKIVFSELFGSIP